MPLDGTLPDVFLPYQQELWRTVSANALTVVEKSRRTGFSWALGAIAASTASAARSAGGMDVLYMGYEREMTREFIGYVADWAKAFQVAASAVEEFVFVDPDKPEAQIGAFRIRFASGYEVVALPSVPRALRGKQGLVILDEAAFMDDLAEVLKAALALLIWGGRVVVVSTHNGEANPFNILVNDIRGGRQKGIVGRTTFDDALAAGLYKRICYVAGKPWTPAAETKWKAEILAIYRDNADEELHVIPNPISGTFLPGPLLTARQVAGIPVLRFDAPKGFNMLAEAVRKIEMIVWMREHLDPILHKLNPARAHAFGYDIARRGDVSVIWLFEIGLDLVRRTVLVVEMRNTPFSDQRAVLWRVRELMPRPRGGCIDATGMGMQMAEESTDKWGASVVGVMLSESWYRENMPHVKTAFEDAMVTVPADDDIETDLRSLKLVRGVARVPDRVRDDAGRQRHGDAAIALALAYAASRAEPEEYGYEAARPQPARSHERAEDQADAEDRRDAYEHRRLDG